MALTGVDVYALLIELLADQEGVVITYDIVDDKGVVLRNCRTGQLGRYINRKESGVHERNHHQFV